MGKARENAKRRTKRQRAARVKRVLELIAEGKFYSEIAEMLSIEWSMTERMVYKYIELSNNELQEQITKEDINEFLLKYKHLYRVAMGRGDHKLAKQVLDSIGKFQHGEKQNISGDISINGIEIKIVKSNDATDSQES